jgi:hypothetical protein
MLGANREGHSMTKKQWLAATDWQKMRRHIEQRTDYERKVRLFSVACCRRIAHLFEDPRSDEAVAVSELFADGKATRKQLQGAERAVLKAVHEAVAEHGANAQAWARDAAWRTARHEFIHDGAESCLRAVAHTQAEVEAQTVLFRDIFGIPFGRARRPKSWLTSDVLLLARGIYEEKAFDRMPILADALQDAGCTSEDVLSHCRDTNQLHVRGCWVVDLLLGMA